MKTRTFLRGLVVTSNILNQMLDYNCLLDFPRSHSDLVSPAIVSHFRSAALQPTHSGHVEF